MNGQLYMFCCGFRQEDLKSILILVYRSINLLRFFTSHSEPLHFIVFLVDITDDFK